MKLYCFLGTKCCAFSKIQNWIWGTSKENIAFDTKHVAKSYVNNADHFDFIAVYLYLNCIHFIRIPVDSLVHERVSAVFSSLFHLVERVDRQKTTQNQTNWRGWTWNKRHELERELNSLGSHNNTTTTRTLTVQVITKNYYKWFKNNKSMKTLNKYTRRFIIFMV